MDATITLTSGEQAYYLAQTIVTATGSGVATSKTRRDGTRDVMLSKAALEALAELDEHSDGHFDGQYVWIGGTEYQVRGL